MSTTRGAKRMIPIVLSPEVRKAQEMRGEDYKNMISTLLDTLNYHSAEARHSLVRGERYINMIGAEKYTTCEVSKQQANCTSTQASVYKQEVSRVVRARSLALPLAN